MSEWFNSLKNNHNYGGLGGSIKEPSNSILSTDVIQYDDSDTVYEFPKNYKKKQPITDKTNNIIANSKYSSEGSNFFKFRNVIRYEHQ